MRFLCFQYEHLVKASHIGRSLNLVRICTWFLAVNTWRIYEPSVNAHLDT